MERSNLQKIFESNLFIMICFIILIGLAYLIYSLFPIPFGIYFNIAVYLFIISCFVLFTTIGLRLLRLKKIWKRISGVILLTLATLILMLTLIISIDYRTLYFKGIPPSPSKEKWGEDLKYLEHKMDFSFFPQIDD